MLPTPRLATVVARRFAAVRERLPRPPGVVLPGRRRVAGRRASARRGREGCPTIPRVLKIQSRMGLLAVLGLLIAASIILWVVVDGARPNSPPVSFPGDVAATDPAERVGVSERPELFSARAGAPPDPAIEPLPTSASPETETPNAGPAASEDVENPWSAEIAMLLAAVEEAGVFVRGTDMKCSPNEASEALRFLGASWTTMPCEPWSSSHVSAI